METLINLLQKLNLNKEEKEYISLFKEQAVVEDFKLAKEVYQADESESDMTESILVFRNIYAMRNNPITDILEEVIPLEEQILYRKKILGDFVYYQAVQEKNVWKMKF